ncbi:MAG: response regulator [Methanoregula sp.]|jgi:PAS domain S-box-containing protein|nr:response regulator [Methanoregula sp.]
MITLLYVDDEPDLLDLGKLFLERGGEFSVTITCSAQDGLEKLSTSAFDAVISDYQMPDMDGLEFLNQVRSLYGNLPFILFTGRGREEVVIEAINLGVDFYLQKGGDAKSQFAELRHKILIALERRRTVDALKSENEKNRNLMDHASDAIFIIDIASGRFIDANKKAREITGLSPDEITARPHLSIHPPAYHDKYRAAFETITRDGSGSLTLIILGADGRYIPMIVSATVIDLGGRHCIMGIFHDISEIQMTQDALQLANKKLSMLTEITRHDIRNKLTVIGGYLDLVKSRPPEPDFSMYLKKIMSTVKIIGENIEFSKLYQDLGVTAPVWQNVHDVFFHACAHIDIKNLTVQSDTRDLELFADPHLERAFYNVIENSLQHGGPVTLLRITATESPYGEVTIHIEDNGTGIPPFDKASIFGKGFGKNTGLGLFLVQEILSITGITICENGEYQRGARFEMRVPQGKYRYPRNQQAERCHIMMPASEKS